MNRLCTDITETIGNTPLVQVPIRNSGWEFYLKMEKANPGQSMKDRMALSMICAAEKSGQLKPGGTIIESSSGNTATGLAMIAAARGYKFIAVVDHHAVREKIDIIRAYGAQIMYVGGNLPPDKVAVREREDTAERLSIDIPNSIFLNQADNPNNPLGYEPLAREIIDQLEDVRVLFGGIGTGGSLCGVARSLKSHDPSIQVYAIEPHGSVIFGGPDGPYFQSGTGNPGSVEIADNVDYSVIDGHYLSSDKEAFNTARFLARNKGILVGGSTGGAIYQALEDLDRRTGTGRAVAIVVDGGEKYISTIFNDEWMHANKLTDISVDMRLQVLLNLFAK